MATYISSQYSKDSYVPNTPGRDLSQSVVAGTSLLAENISVTKDMQVDGQYQLSGSYVQEFLEGVRAPVKHSNCGSARIDVHLVSTTQEHTLGTQYVEGPNVYRYVSLLSQAVTPGAAVQGFPGTGAGANKLAATSVSGVVGSYTVVFTNNTTAVTENQFRDGTLVIAEDATTAVRGHSYRVKSNTADTTTMGNVTVTLYEPLRQAVGGVASGIEISVNPYARVRIVPMTTQTYAAVGIAQFNLTSVAADRFAWVQTRGIGAFISAGITSVAGRGLSIPGGGAAGCVIMKTATAKDEVIYGVCAASGAAGAREGLPGWIGGAFMA